MQKMTQAQELCYNAVMSSEGKVVKTKLNSPKKRLLIILVVLVGVFTAGWLVYQKASAPAVKKETINAKKTVDQNYNDIRSSGDKNTATYVLQQQLKQAKTDQQKIEALSLLGYDSLSNKDYKQANAYAQKMLAIRPKADGAYVLLARSSAAQGNKTAAREYMTQALESLDKTAPQYDMMVREYEQYKKELGL